MHSLIQTNIFLKSMASAVSEKVKEKRNRVLLGPLPDDFLRVNVSQQEQQEAADRQAAIALQQQYTSGVPQMPNSIGILNITVVQAKLTKNYGMVRMDPYCRIRIGHIIKETQTATSGAKNPRWNKVISCLMPQGISTMTIEVFDERSFMPHELIAWTEITIPQQVFAGETHEKWYPLSGKQGEGLEGTINLVLSFNAGAHVVYQHGYNPVIVPRVDSTAVKPLKVYRTLPTEGNPAATETPPVLNETDLKQIQEMFPNIENEVIKTVFEANGGNKDGTINSLLQMAD